MKKTYIKALILLAALTAASSCEDSLDIVETDASIDDVLEIDWHGCDNGVDLDWNPQYELLLASVKRVASGDRGDRQLSEVAITVDAPDWTSVWMVYDHDLPSKRISISVGDNYGKEPREGLVTVTIATAWSDYITFQGKDKVKIPYQKMQKSFTIHQDGR